MPIRFKAIVLSKSSIEKKSILTLIMMPVRTQREQVDIVGSEWHRNIATYKIARVSRLFIILDNSTCEPRYNLQIKQDNIPQRKLFYLYLWLIISQFAKWERIMETKYSKRIW